MEKEREEERERGRLNLGSVILCPRQSCLVFAWPKETKQGMSGDLGLSRPAD